MFERVVPHTSKKITRPFYSHEQNMNISKVSIKAKHLLKNFNKDILADWGNSYKEQRCHPPKKKKNLILYIFLN